MKIDPFRYDPSKRLFLKNTVKVVSGALFGGLLLSRKAAAQVFTVGDAGFIGNVTAGQATGGGGGGGACTVLDDNLGVGTNANIATWISSSWNYLGGIWIPGDLVQRCKFSPRLSITGTLSGTMTLSVYGLDGGNPARPTGAALQTSSSVNISVLTGTAAYIDFSGITFTPSASTNYGVAVFVSATSDASNFITWTGQFTSAGATVATFVSTNGSSWTGDDSSSTVTLKTWHT